MANIEYHTKFHNTKSGEGLEVGDVMQVFNGGGYNLATILYFWEENDTVYAKVARPQAVAEASFHCNQPLISCEVYDIPATSLDVDKRVYKGMVR